MNVLNISSFVLITLLLISHSTKGKNVESYVPEDIEDGFSIDEEEDIQSDSERPKWSESTIDEYMKEHPEIKQMPTIDGKSAQIKKVYNKYGNVISIPVTPKPKMPAFPLPFPYYPFMFNPYIIPRKVMPNIPVIPRTPILPGSPVTAEEAVKYKMPADREEKDLNTKSDSELNEKIYNLMGSYPKFYINQNYTKRMNVSSVLPMPFPPLQPFQYPGLNQLQKQFAGQPQMNPMIGPYPPFFPQYPFYIDPSKLKVDEKNSKGMPMPSPNDIVIDTDLFKQIQSGSVQLDMNNAKIIPMSESTTEATTQMETMGTESESLDNRPELPEVVFPKTTAEPTFATLTKRRLKYNRPFNKKRHNRRPKLHPNEAPKPHFIMKATLKHLPKKSDKGKDKWWNQPIPDYCEELIYEVTLCKNKHLEKRWSFNKRDGKCYLYEDECHSLKRNTFKTIKECMYTCWRPK